MNVVEILNDYMKMIGTFTRECSFLTVYICTILYEAEALVTNSRIACE